MIEKVTFVVIGRNEAANLPRCFRSILKFSNNIIFVDSDSDDQSISIAKEFNIDKIIKVKANYGSPGLSRSVGAKEVETEYIQFLDGDMTIDGDWISVALEKLEENKNIAAVQGYRKEFRKNDRDYFILSDVKDWEPDYMLGAFLIKKEIFDKAGGFDIRIYGEEDRDLYVRIKSIGYQVWYIHHLMASHYNFKVNTIKPMLFGERTAVIWIPLIKALKDKNFKSYLFVYRRLLIPLLLDVLTFLSVFLGPVGFVVSAMTLQIIELVYVVSVKRKGYFLVWKVGVLNLYKAIKLYNRKVSYEISDG